MFMQHFVESLKGGGRAAIVIKNTFLSNTDGASIALRKQLMDDCNLHTILDCPGGTFLGAGVKMNQTGFIGDDLVLILRRY